MEDEGDDGGLGLKREKTNNEQWTMMATTATPTGGIRVKGE